MITVTPDAPVESLWPGRQTQAQSRLVNALWHGGIKTVSALVNSPASELRGLYGIGPAAVAEIRRVLAERGLSLRGEGGRS